MNVYINLLVNIIIVELQIKVLFIEFPSEISLSLIQTEQVTTQGTRIMVRMVYYSRFIINNLFSFFPPILPPSLLRNIQVYKQCLGPRHGSQLKLDVHFICQTNPHRLYKSSCTVLYVNYSQNPFTTERPSQFVFISSVSRCPTRSST